MKSDKVVYFSVQPNYFSFSFLPHEIYVRLKEEFSYYRQNYQYSEKYQNNLWDGKDTVLNGNTLPIGMLDRAVFLLESLDYVVEIDLLHGIPVMLPTTYTWHGPELRYYQTEAVETFLERKKGILEIGTGGGKTLIATRVIYELGCSAVFIANGEDSLHQIASAIEKCIGGVKVFKCSGKNKLKEERLKDADKFVLVSTHKMVRKFQIVNEVPLLIVDECHHLGAKDVYKTVSSIPAYYRLGLSASPFREDNRDMWIHAQLGEILYSKPVAQLADENYLLKPVVHFCYYDSDVEYSTERYTGAYQGDYWNFIVNNRMRNELIVKIATDKKRFVLIIVDRIEHGEILLDMLKASEWDGEVLFAQGDSSKEVRKKALEPADAKVVIATTIFDEAVDAPAIDAVILAAGGKAQGRFMQRVGRVLRTYKGQTEGTVFDFYDDLALVLEKHTNERMQNCIKMNYDIRKLNFQKKDQLKDLKEIVFQGSL